MIKKGQNLGRYEDTRIRRKRKIRRYEVENKIAGYLIVLTSFSF